MTSDLGLCLRVEKLERRLLELLEITKSLTEGQTLAAEVMRTQEREIDELRQYVYHGGVDS